MKYTDTMVAFSEVPDEISLCINISNCPNHCPSCHSKELWENIGNELNPAVISELISSNEGISCVCFMGGDSDVEYLFELADYVICNYPELKTAWYSGKPEIFDGATDVFDYIKIGPYIEEYGPLNSDTTNQRMYKVLNDNTLEDITKRFFKKIK